MHILEQPGTVFIVCYHYVLQVSPSLPVSQRIGTNYLTVANLMLQTRYFTLLIPGSRACGRGFPRPYTVFFFLDISPADFGAWKQIGIAQLHKLNYSCSMLTLVYSRH